MVLLRSYQLGRESVMVLTFEIEKFELHTAVCGIPIVGQPLGDLSQSRPWAAIQWLQSFRME
jgi:hypothetical protein